MRENSERVAEALLTLDPLSREVLVLRFHEELSLEEIADLFAYLAKPPAK